MQNVRNYCLGTLRVYICPEGSGDIGAIADSTHIESVNDSKPYSVTNVLAAPSLK
jgi:hypothetical protein